MHLTEIARFAQIKGLNIVGTGDFTHPKWFKEIKETLFPISEKGLYKIAGSTGSQVYFILTTEVCTLFTFENALKKIHHIILTPNINTALQVNDRLSKYGDLVGNGRPVLRMDAAHLVEEVMEVSSENMVFPAHAWTPWYSIFGAFSGFDNVEDCYQDMAKHIYALETGLSSDPPMNWRLSQLDKFTLVSNSDSHSFWPWRIGREANVFELKKVSYHKVLDIIRSKDKTRFKFTIETYPAYGKYHLTGHRKCQIVLSANQAIKLKNICPICRRNLTKGVEQRVQELSDRSISVKPENAIGFIHLLPLSTIIATVLNSASPSSKKVWNIYNLLITKFGNEYRVLIDASFDELSKVVEKNVAEAIIKVREGFVKVLPGYDGVYGRLLLRNTCKKPSFSKKVQQSNLTDFY